MKARFEVYLINLDPIVGREIKKTRPCLNVSPDEMNKHLSTVIIAPMTTKGKAYPMRVRCKFQGRDRTIVLDQIRSVDTLRLVKRLGVVSAGAQGAVLAVLAAMFAP